MLSKLFFESGLWPQQDLITVPLNGDFHGFISMEQLLYICPIASTPFRVLHFGCEFKESIYLAEIANGFPLSREGRKE